jgi:hypothetical protein
MAGNVRKWTLAAVVAAGAWSLSVAADDEKKPASTSTPDKMPDWSKNYASAGDISGEITKADEKGITLQVTELVPNGSGGYKSSKYSGKSAVKQKKTDIELKFADGGMVRWATKPKKTDEKGKSVPLSPKEQEDLKKPAGAPGYAANRTDLKAGHVVEIVLLRPKSIAVKDAKIGDLEIKYVMIQGTDPNAASKDDEKKDPDKKKK